MLGYSWRVLTRKRPLWVPTTICALLTAAPGLLMATVLAVPLTALLLSGDPLVALRLLPGPLNSAGWRGSLSWGLVGVGSLIVLALWTRIYVAALWLSIEERDATFRDALRDTRAHWRTAFLVHLEALVAIGVVVSSVVFLLIIARTGGASGTGVFLAISIVLMFRSVVRVGSTLALRATVFDGMDHLDAWRRGFAIMSERRSETIAAWMTLLAAGAAVWIGGRLITPVLQEITLAYPHDSGYALAREMAQILYAVPLESFLLAYSIGVWTAVYLGGDALREHPVPRTASTGADPWVIKALATLAVLVVIGNGVPTVIDARYDRSLDAEKTLIANREIDPEDVIRPEPALEPSANSYTVTATIDDRDLTWTTRILYTNETSTSLGDIGIHVYPAAYARELADLPLAGDLTSGDVSGAFARDAEPGTFEVMSLSIDGRETPGYTREDTALLTELRTPLKPGRRVTINLQLHARLPTYPERFGVWGDQTLLGNWIPVVAEREDGAWRLDDFGTIGDPFFAGVADYDVTFDAPERQQIVGTGILTNVTAGAAGRVRWRFSAPAVRDAAFVVGPFLRGLEGHVGGTRVRSWFQADQKTDGDEALATALSAVEDFTAAYGSLPFDEVEVVATGGYFGGMEYPGLVFVSGTDRALEGLPVLPDLLEHAGFNEAQRRYVTGHEVAHQWWYAAVGNDQVREPWLDETLAEVSVRLWLRGKDGSDRTYLMTNLAAEVVPRRGVLGSGIEDFTTNNDYSEAINLQGTEVLLRLRRQMGPERFTETLRAYFEGNIQGVGTTGEFIKVLRGYGGPEAVAELAPYL